MCAQQWYINSWLYLADCIFHVLMSAIAAEINHVIEGNDEFQAVLERADLHVESVIWEDDLAN